MSYRHYFYALSLPRLTQLFGSGDGGYEFSMDASPDGRKWSGLMDESFRPAR